MQKGQPTSDKSNIVIRWTARRTRARLDRSRERSQVRRARLQSSAVEASKILKKNKKVKRLITQLMNLGTRSQALFNWNQLISIANWKWRFFTFDADAAIKPSRKWASQVIVIMFSNYNLFPTRIKCYFFSNAIHLNVCFVSRRLSKHLSKYKCLNKNLTLRACL